MPEKTAISLVLHKLLGGLGGNLVALSILKPANIKDALARTLSSVILAYFATPPIAKYFDVLGDIDMEMAIAAGIGLTGWFVAALLLKTVNKAESIKELKDNVK